NRPSSDHRTARVSIALVPEQRGSPPRRGFRPGSPVTGVERARQVASPRRPCFAMGLWSPGPLGDRTLPNGDLTYEQVQYGCLFRKGRQFPTRRLQPVLNQSRATIRTVHGPYHLSLFLLLTLSFLRRCQNHSTDTEPIKNAANGKRRNSNSSEPF